MEHRKSPDYTQSLTWCFLSSELAPYALQCPRLLNPNTVAKREFVCSCLDIWTLIERFIWSLKWFFFSGITVSLDWQKMTSLAWANWSYSCFTATAFTESMTRPSQACSPCRWGGRGWWRVRREVELWSVSQSCLPLWDTFYKHSMN